MKFNLILLNNLFGFIFPPPIKWKKNDLQKKLD
ncbi:hypothetical protein LCGC14_1159580 [marine sediment metagenome]|uniref:Uncharacterized protein n=1 Tax=marine sediment metagenome TaxID=412755 RepID=A0A0F9LT30_9ZZZZ